MNAKETAYDLLNRVSAAGWGDEITDEFAKAIEAAIAEEREACAKMCDNFTSSGSYLGGYSVGDVQKIAADKLAAAIRKRGTP